MREKEKTEKQVKQSDGDIEAANRDNKVGSTRTTSFSLERKNCNLRTNTIAVAVVVVVFFVIL